MPRRKRFGVIAGSGGSGERTGKGSLDAAGPDTLEQLGLKGRRAVEGLTPPELEILKGLLRGSSNKQIAHDLYISPSTVELLRCSMMTRLQAKTTADAVRIGIYAGLDLVGEER